MTNHDADKTLTELKKSRKWLAERSKYKVTYLYNVLNGEETVLKQRMAEKFAEIFETETALQKNPFTAGDKIWDQVLFTATEMMHIDRARKESAHETLEEFLHEGAVWYADEIISKTAHHQAQPLKVAEDLDRSTIMDTPPPAYPKKINEH